MSYFFDFNTKLATEVDWFFNLNHLFLLLWVVGFIIVCCFLFHSKSEKGKKITKLSLALILTILEIGRTVYKYLLHLSNGGSSSDFNWWWNISFQMCAIMCWTTIITLILSAFLNKENKLLGYLYNILFGCALIGGALTFCYPDCMSSDRPFLHFLNIQTVTVHALLIFVPIYLIKIGEFKVEIKNIWKLFVGYILIGSLSMTASLISGNNFAYALNFSLFDLGLPFPYHLPVVMVILVLLSTIVYAIFEIVRYIKNKKSNTVNKPCAASNKNKFDIAFIVTSFATAIIFGIVILLGISSLIGKDTQTLLGLLCLLPLAYTILWLVFAEKIKNQSTQEFASTKPCKHISLIIIALLFNLPVGVLYLIKFIKLNKSKAVKTLE